MQLPTVIAKGAPKFVKRARKLDEYDEDGANISKELLQGNTWYTASNLDLASIDG